MAVALEGEKSWPRPRRKPVSFSFKWSAPILIATPMQYALKVRPSGRNEICRTGGRQLAVVNDGGRGLQRQLAVVIDGGCGLQSTG